MFSLSEKPIDPVACAEELKNPRAGALVTFEGWVRDHNDGRPVTSLIYEAFDSMAVSEGRKLLEEAKKRFTILEAHAVHRIGPTVIGDLAVWVGVASEHRQEAFLAGRWIMDEIKRSVPVWKKESYADQDCSEWINTGSEANPVGEDPSENPQYSRQIAIKGFGKEGQRKLANASILVIGAGGLGCPALQYLAAAGIGSIRIADGDSVEITNLHRQVLFGNSDLGRNKAEAAAERLRNLNPNISLQAIADAAYADTLPEMLTGVDLVLDCTDGFDSKYGIHDVCWRAGVPVVQASVHQFDGWVQIIDPGADSGCYRCQWPEAPPAGCVGTCAEAGVLGVTPGTLGVLQATQAISFLIDHPDALRDAILYMDVFSGRTRRIKRVPGDDCPCRGNEPWPEESGNLLMPGTRATKLASEATLIDLREPVERTGDPDWIQQLPSAPRSEWPSLLDRFQERPLILCCAGGRRAISLLKEMGNPPGVYAWSKSIHEMNTRW